MLEVISCVNIAERLRQHVQCKLCMWQNYFIKRKLSKNGRHRREDKNKIWC